MHKERVHAITESPTKKSEKPPKKEKIIGNWKNPKKPPKEKVQKIQKLPKPLKPAGPINLPQPEKPKKIQLPRLIPLHQQSLQPQPQPIQPKMIQPQLIQPQLLQLQPQLLLQLQHPEPHDTTHTVIVPQKPQSDLDVEPPQLQIKTKRPQDSNVDKCDQCPFTFKYKNEIYIHNIRMHKRCIACKEVSIFDCELHREVLEVTFFLLGSFAI